MRFISAFLFGAILASATTCKSQYDLGMKSCQKK